MVDAIGGRLSSNAIEAPSQTAANDGAKSDIYLKQETIIKSYYI